MFFGFNKTRISTYAKCDMYNLPTSPLKLKIEPNDAWRLKSSLMKMP